MPRLYLLLFLLVSFRGIAQSSVDIRIAGGPLYTVVTKQVADSYTKGGNTISGALAIDLQFNKKNRSFYPSLEMYLGLFVTRFDEYDRNNFKVPRAGKNAEFHTFGIIPTINYSPTKELFTLYAGVGISGEINAGFLWFPVEPVIMNFPVTAGIQINVGRVLFGLREYTTIREYRAFGEDSDWKYGNHYRIFSTQLVFGVRLGEGEAVEGN